MRRLLVSFLAVCSLAVLFCAGVQPSVDLPWFKTERAFAQIGPLVGYGPLPMSACVVTTWNPSAKGANITLSNGNLTATGATAYNSVLATLGRSTGKWYWELAVTTATSTNTMAGFATSGATLTTWLGNSATGVGWQNNNNVNVNGITSSVAPGVTWTTGDVYNMAIDLSTGKGWVGKNGTWTSGSPSAGTLPNITFSTLTLFPGYASGDSSDSGTGRFLNAQFTGTVPSGFLSWSGC